MSKKKKAGKKKTTLKQRKKKKTVKRRSSTATPKRAKNDAPGLKRSRVRWIFLIAWNIFGALGVFFSLWVVFNPNIFVYTSHTLDPNNPVFTPFVTRNQGYLAIYDVKFEWAIKHLRTDSGINIIGLGEYENRFSETNQIARVIAPGEEYSVRPSLSRLKYNKFENMDIAIVVSFRPFKLWPWRYMRLRRFVTKEGKDGQCYWFPMPIKK